MMEALRITDKLKEHLTLYADGVRVSVEHFNYDRNTEDEWYGVGIDSTNKDKESIDGVCFPVRNRESAVVAAQKIFAALVEAGA